MRSAVLFLSYLFFPLIPLTRFFGLKAFLVRLAGGQLGKNVRIASSARFYVGGCFTIGEGTWIGEDVLITGGEADITIGRNCDLGPRVTIALGTHGLWSSPGRAAGPGISESITIGDGVWIGAGATILGGVKIGDCTMIAAGALVKSDIDSYSVAAGVPAKVVRRAPAEVQRVAEGFGHSYD